MDAALEAVDGGVALGTTARQHLEALATLEDVGATQQVIYRS